MNDRGYTLLEILINLAISFSIVFLIAASFWIMHVFVLKWSTAAFSTLQELNTHSNALNRLTYGPDVAESFQMHHTLFNGGYSYEPVIKNSGFGIRKWLLVHQNGDSVTWFVSSFKTPEWRHDHAKE